MKIKIQTDVHWNRREAQAIKREAADNVLAERAKEASASKCEVHGETATVTPTRGGSGEIAISACCHEQRDRVARFLGGDG